MPLFGTRKLKRFDENIGALRVRPTEADLAETEAAKFVAKGDRYPAAVGPPTIAPMCLGSVHGSRRGCRVVLKCATLRVVA